MDKYIVLRSTDCKSLYPNNESYDFKLELGETLHLDQRWSMALCDMSIVDEEHYVEEEEGKCSVEEDKCPSVAEDNQSLYVCSSLCDTSFVGEGRECFLRHLLLKNIKKDEHFTFAHPYYIPIKVHDLQTIDLYIKDREGNSASFIKGTVTATLHLKSLPFWF
jgi:hypothetical protein